MIRRIGRLTCLLAGACDVATGLLLVGAPDAALRLMRVGDPVTELVWMRFIGAFVAGVGALYLYGLAREPRGGPRLAALMAATALVRTVIAIFVGGAMASGALSLAWISVFLTDASLAIAQVVLLRLGAFDAAE